MKSFVFHSLEDIFHRFDEFYGLVSREAVSKNSLDEKFGSMVLIKPSAAIRPREHITHIPPTGQPADRQVIHAFF